MRVLHVTECYDGGVKTVIDEYAEGLTDIEHGLLYRGTGTPSAAFAGKAARLPATVPLATAAVRRYSGWPDLIHAHSSWAGLYARLTTFDVPVIYQPHCYAFEDSTQPASVTAAFRTVERLLAPRAVATIGVSHHEVDLARTLGCPRVALVPNASRLSIGPQTSGPPKTPTVAMVGRICPQKDPEFFRSAAVAAPDLRFRWLGDGDERERARLQQAGVDVSGWLPPDQLAVELAAATIYLHTARWEGFPVTVLDAARLNVPIVAREIPALSGYELQTVTTPEQAVSEIRRAVRDDAWRDQLICTGHALEAQMNPATQLAAMRKVYREVAPCPS